MPGFERTITIDRPAPQVFAVLDDIQNARRWMPAIRKIQVMTPSHAVDVGYKWRETRRMMGILRITMPVEIVRHEQDKAWGIVVDDGKVRATATFELVPKGPATLVTLREDVEDLRGSPQRAARMARMMEKSDDDLLVRLKAYAESLHRLPPPTMSLEKARRAAAGKVTRTSPPKSAAGKPAKKAKAGKKAR